MKMESTEQKTYSEVIGDIFDVPSDDRQSLIFHSMISKFEELMRFEDNTEILVSITDYFIRTNEPSKISSFSDIVRTAADTQFTIMLTGFMYGYLYRMKEAREEFTKHQKWMDKKY